MEVTMDPKFKQQLDDVFDAFTMLSGGAIVNLMHVQGNTTRWSPAGVELFGLSGEYIPNGSMDWGDYVHPEDRKRYLDVMLPLASGERQTYDLTYRVRTKDGSYGNFRVIGSVLRNAEGLPSMIGGVLINQGLTENVDPVTVLRNRNAYLEDLEKQIRARKNTVSLQVGISGLCKINQMHGYTYGNRLLQEMAWIIQEIVKGRGSVYRLEDASFAVLTTTLSREEVAAIYDMVRYRFQRGVEINGIRNILSTSGGLVSTNGADTDEDTALACLHYAYAESKRRRHGELVDFNGSIHYGGAKSLELINIIRDCVLDDCRGFAMEYEPVISAKTEKMTGAEAHVYWQNERYGKVDAGDFLPILERDFVFEELSDFVLRQSLTDGVKLLEKVPDYLLCVNVYRIQLESDYFIDNLLTLLRETGFPPEKLSLKFTAECRYIDMARMNDIVKKLHKHGILVVIDGFGSGINSIVFLKNVPVDAVCLDDEFINGIEESGRNRTIVSHLIQMASACVEHINMKGVRNAELRDIIRGYPVTTMQGGYYFPPLSREQLLDAYAAQ